MGYFLLLHLFKGWNTYILLNSLLFIDMTTDVTSRLTALLTRTNVKTNDLPSLLTKLQTVIGDGADKLCVMADFDFTITKRWNDDEKSIGCPSTYDIIKRSNLIEKHLSDAMKALFLKYWPIETDPNMSVEDKTPFIVEWISSEMRVMREAGLTKDKLALMMETHGLVPRDRFEAFCSSTSKARIPLVVSTAGLADVVEGALRGWNVLSENVAIIGNRFSWDPVDKSLLGVEGDVVHTQNKEHSMSEFFAKFEKDGKYNNNRGDAGDGSADTALTFIVLGLTSFFSAIHW